MPNIEWLLHEAVGDLTLPLGPHFKANDKNWRASIERVILAPSLHVFLTDVLARRDMQVDPKHDRTGQWVGSQVTIAGRADIDFLNGDFAGATPDNAVFFRLPGQHACYHLKAGARFHSAGYTLDLERIVRMFDGEIPAALAPLLDPDTQQSRWVVARADRLMRDLAGRLFARNLTGVLRRMMMEGVILEIFAAQTAAAGEQLLPRSHRALTSKERTAVRAARERLLADMRAPPTLGELAQAVKLTERRLNHGFRVLFGTTVFETLRNERLECARLAMEEGVSLGDVALLVGYNHANNFIRAFSARFGVAPRRYLERKE